MFLDLPPELFKQKGWNVERIVGNDLKVRMNGTVPDKWVKADEYPKKGDQIVCDGYRSQ